MLKRSRADKRKGGWSPAGEGLLLVCDDPDAGELLSRLLARDGHDVHRVETAEGALRHLLATPRHGAVLSLSGPASNRQLVEKVRTHPNPPVSEVALLVLAEEGADAAAAEHDAWTAGADGFLARPFHESELTEELTAALDRPLDDRPAHREARLAGD